MPDATLILRKPDDRRRAAKWIAQAPEGTTLEFTGPHRSTDQNRLLWALLTDISTQVVWYGQKLAPADWKDVLTASLRKARVVPGLDGGFVPLGMRTSKMSKAEFSELLELIRAFGAQQGVVFRDSEAEAA